MNNAEKYPLINALFIGVLSLICTLGTLPAILQAYKTSVSYAEMPQPASAFAFAMVFIIPAMQAAAFYAVIGHKNRCDTPNVNYNSYNANS